MSPPPSRRARRAVIVLAAAVLVAYLGYVGTAWYFLSTGRLKALVNKTPDRTSIEYRSASSVWPGRARVKNFRIRDRDLKAEWTFELEDARISFSVLGLVRRRLHVTSLSGSGATFRARNRLTPREAADPERLAPLPPIPGFPDPPRLQPGEHKPPKTGKEWTIRVDDIEIDPLREIWVNAYRYAGDGRLTGAFFLQPKIHAQVVGGELTTEGGTLSTGKDSLAEDVKASVRGKVDAWNPREFPGTRMLRFVSGEAQVTARLPDMDLVNQLLGDLAGTRFERGGGALAVRGTVERGVAQGSVDLDAPRLALRIVDVGFRGRLAARANFSGLDLLKGGALLTGGYLNLTDATVSGTGEGARPWWMKVSFLPGRLRPERGVLLTGAVSARARDGRPFLALVKGLPGWLEKRFDVEGLAGRARIRLGESLVDVERLTARAGDFRIDGEYRARGASRSGTFLVDAGLISVGIGISGGKTELDVLGPRRWFRKRTGWEPAQD
ncbi:MAG: hypothetical protein M3542_00065 [Acidobacteriota bacterium]|nr:hypothetical protein [Acidobacteriota bacterium]MDQ5871512.1 hypothetical protein [Acidobacteriota bacterium]